MLGRLLTVKTNFRFVLATKIHRGEQTRRIRKPNSAHHIDSRHHNDIFHIFLGLKQLQQILLAVIEHHDLIADIFFQEK